MEPTRSAELEANGRHGRIVYVAMARIPSRSTNGLQVMRMCDGFASVGSDVTLVHPYRIAKAPEGYEGDIQAFYGVRGRFARVTLPTPLTPQLAGRRWISRPVQGVPLTAYLSWRARPGNPPFYCYTRSTLGAQAARWARRLCGSGTACHGVYFEAHDLPRTLAAWQIVGQADGVFAISGALRDQLIVARPDLADRVWVAHDGVDAARIAEPVADRGDARRRLNLPQEGFLAVYTGRVNQAKGGAVLLDAARQLQSHGVRFVLVGKVYEDELRQRAERLSNVTLTGYVPPAHVSDYLAAADALLLPSTEDLAYAAFTSPLKMFEYMAADRPIVASGLPVLREVLTDGENALLYGSPDAGSLVAALRVLIDDQHTAHRLAARARRDVAAYTWSRRAERILHHITNPERASSVA